VWKRDPIMAFCKRWAPAQRAWAAGDTVTMCIGYDAGRAIAAGRSSPKARPGGLRQSFPLIEWGWDRSAASKEITRAGLPVPMKERVLLLPLPAEVRDRLAGQVPPS
jgi:hypothetical protein